MRIDAFPQAGQWYKGNTHAHTSVSDGKFAPEKLIGEYKKAGYSFLAITDHEIYSDYTQYDTDSFIMMPGVEIMLWQGDRNDAFTTHLVGLGIPGKNKFVHGQKLEYINTTPTQELIDFLHENGNYVILAHPYWSGTRLEHFNEYSQGIDALEIYNNVCNLDYGTGYSEAYFDTALWADRHILCIASDDTHQSVAAQNDFCGGFIMVKAPALNKGSIYKSIAAGHFYASTGPLIDEFYLEDGIAYVKCPPCEKISFNTDFYSGKCVISPDGSLTQASWEYKCIDNDPHFVRCKVEGKNGTAWSQPIWLK